MASLNVDEKKVDSGEKEDAGAKEDAGTGGGGGGGGGGKKTVRKCTICREAGHYAPTCPNIPLDWWRRLDYARSVGWDVPDNYTADINLAWLNKQM